MAVTVEVERIEVNGVGLCVAEAGRGGRPLLLVHGFTGAKEDFTDILDVLAHRGWHAVAPDLRGHGASDHPAGQAAYDLGIFADEVLGLAGELGWERFVILGHSMGGAVAQRLALDHRERVEALILMSTFHGPLDLDTDLVALGAAVVRQGGMPALAEALDARREQDPAAMAARRRIERTSLEQAARQKGKLLSCSEDMWLSMAPRFPVWPDTLPELATLDVPTLVIVGEEDETMRGDCERLAQTIPGASFELVPQTRHSPQLEAPDRFWPPVLAFLGRVAGARADSKQHQ
jgi:pimeloyl-ACP methyl ester carboxylesterase